MDLGFATSNKQRIIPATTCCTAFPDVIPIPADSTRACRADSFSWSACSPAPCLKRDDNARMAFCTAVEDGEFSERATRMMRLPTGFSVNVVSELETTDSTGVAER